MRKLTLTTIGVFAAIGLAAPAFAHDDWNSRHDWQHEQLDRQHDDVHDQLEAEHDAAHEEGLTPWEHRQLHQDLQYQHELADYRIAREHERQHRREAWRRHYSEYGYGYYRY